MARPTLVLALIATTAALSGCAGNGGSSMVAEAPDDAVEAVDEPGMDAEAQGDKPLPPQIEELGLSDAQRADILALRDDLERDIAPLVDSGRDLLDAVTVAVRRCRGDSPMMKMRASNLIATGEQVRPRAIDAVNRFHRILTPEQRLAVSQRLLDREERSRERSGDDTRTRSVGEGLGLSLGQIVQMLIRLQTVRASVEEEIEPWRERYRDALEAFAEDDFDMRKHPIAEAPALEIVVRAGGDALRLLVPLLEPEQCVSIADMMEERMKERRRQTPRGAAAPLRAPPSAEANR